MIGLQDINFKQTRVYRDALKEGWQQGKQEGKQEGELTIILRLLVRRFGNLPESLVVSLRQLDTEQLEAFSEPMLDARSLDDLHQWLQNRQ